MQRFHYLARAIVIQGDQVLVVKSKGQSNTFLPGGHIEFGEAAVEAIEREFMEEIGCVVKVQYFVGALEHVWPSDERNNHEINLLFKADVPEFSAGKEPVSLEAELDVFWVPISSLDRHNLQPTPVRELIQLGQPRGPYWGTTINSSLVR